jgi:hypothetical protein
MLVAPIINDKNKTRATISGLILGWAARSGPPPILASVVTVNQTGLPLQAAPSTRNGVGESFSTTLRCRHTPVGVSAPA